MPIPHRPHGYSTLYGGKYGSGAPSGKRLKLNTVGQRLLVEATSLLAQATRLERSLRDEASGEAGVFSVGYVESAVHAGVLPRALQVLKRLRPQVRVQLHNLRSSAQITALHKGEVDMAFTHSRPSDSDGMTYRRVVYEPFLLAIPCEHPLACAGHATSITAKQLDALDL
jgi:DNA-binding transcriptional LysR family regulator